MDSLQPNIPHNIPQPNIVVGHTKRHFVLVTIIFAILLAVSMVAVDSYFEYTIVSRSTKPVVATEGTLVEGFPQSLVLFSEAKVLSSRKDFTENGMVVYTSTFVSTTTFDVIESEYKNFFEEAGFKTSIPRQDTEGTVELAFEKDKVAAQVLLTQKENEVTFVAEYMLPVLMDVKK